MVIVISYLFGKKEEILLLRKINLYILAFLLIFSLIPQEIFADQNSNTEIEEKVEVVLFGEKAGEKIELFKNVEKIKNEEVLIQIPDDTLVEVLEVSLLDEDEVSEEELDVLEEYIFIRYVEELDDTKETLIYEGYVHKDRIVELENADDFRLKRDFEDENPVSNEETGEWDNHTNNEEESTEEVAENLEELQDSIESFSEPAEKVEQRSLTGLALKQPVHVYESTNQNSTILKSYDYGSLLKYRLHSNEWYKATVYIKGQPKTGYIYASDVGEKQEAKSVKGIALKTKTNVYSDTSKSKILRTYNQGHILKYRAYDKDWFIATVIINGNRQTGFINKRDVETGVEKQTSLTGIGLKSPTKIYQRASTSSNTLKSYAQGRTLKYREFTSNWYEATVYIKGKQQTGYIHKKDVEEVVSELKSLQGVGIKNPTKVHQRASITSKTLKSYSYGSILKLKEFTSNWYQATVYIKGKAQIGYIHKGDIGSLDQSLNGYAQKNPTVVYSDMSRNSSKLKTYSIGSKLKYKAYNKDWYQATVIINGERKQGYIHTKDVASTGPVLNGYAYKEPTKVYTKTSRNSKVLKSYKKGSNLKYRYYNNNWYQATVIIKGKRQTGYIHKNDAGLTPPTLTGLANKSPTHVYAKTSRNSSSLKSYKKGSLLKYKPYSKNWYQATVIINGKSRKGYIHKNDIGKATDISFVNPYKTYTYNDMVNDIKSLQKAYPDLIQYKVIGKSEYGRNIYAVSLGKGKATTFINGSIHAREWISTNLNMYMLENYAKSYTKNQKINGYNTRKILNETTIWFMPMVNPDGVTLQQRGLNVIPKKDHAALIKANGGSKNFKRWKANGKGTDINRNFSVEWKNQNSPSGPSHQNYRGSKALSAKESQAMVELVKEVNPQMAINYHTSGRVLYWAHRQSGTRYTRDLGYAREISKMTGYSIIPKSSNPKGGGFLQWFTETTKNPALTPELAPYAGNTNVSPTREFSRIWNENKSVGLYAAQESAKLNKK